MFTIYTEHAHAITCTTNRSLLDVYALGFRQN